MDTTTPSPVPFRHRLLTAEEEADLGKRISAARAAPDGHPVIADGDRALARLVESNVRLAAHHTHRQAGRQLSFDDLFTHALAALVRAARKFDPAHGYRFSTYASVAICRSLSRAVTQQLRYRQHVAPADDDVLAGVLATETSAEERIVTSHAAAEAVQQVRQLCDDLPATLQQFVTLRYGLDGGGVRTLDDVADHLGITHTDALRMEADTHRRMAGTGNQAPAPSRALQVA